ncbi:MAG: outer membrane beta-barrel protein [Acidobacteriota bacterium]
MAKLLFALLLSAPLAFPAGLFTLGVKGGIPFTDAIENARNSRQWTLGPELDINLPFGISIEADALYRRANSDTANASSWDFPILLKYKFPGFLARPYLAAGPTFNGFAGVSRALQLKNDFNAGLTLGAGLQLLGHISPEIRYTRWGWDSFRDPSGLLKSNPNQLSFLVGLTF